MNKQDNLDDFRYIVLPARTLNDVAGRHTYKDKYHQSAVIENQNQEHLQGMNAFQKMDMLDDVDCIDVLQQFLSEPEIDNVSLEYSSLPLASLDDEASEVTPKIQNPPLTMKSGAQSQKRIPFPIQLHEMVTHNNMESIISWLPHGRAFMVHDVEKFVAEVLPKYFNHSKFSSFQRQLNSYGFRRFTQGRDAGAYYHESFQRGRPYLCSDINRIKGKLEPLGPEGEINFYALPFIDAAGNEMKCNPPLPPVPTPMVAPQKRIRRMSLKAVNVEKGVVQNWKKLIQAETAKSNITQTPQDMVAGKAFPFPGGAKKEDLSMESKMPEKLPIDILPLSNHPLDQTTFFIPLDMLLNSA